MDAPIITSESASTILIRERLRLLSLGYYISGGIGAVFASFMLMYVAMLGAMSFLPDQAWTPPAGAGSISSGDNSSPQINPAFHSERSSAPPQMVFRIMAGVMGFFVVCGWILSGLTIYAGYCVKQRKHKIFIHIIAGINAIWIPYGTLLSIASFLVLCSEAGKSEFTARTAQP